MKKALKKLSAAVLAMAMIASLTPVTGGLVLADETDVPETTSSTETEAPKETVKPAETTKETEKQAKETQKETEATEPETSKETEGSETEAPKETESPETEAPKETKITETDIPKESADPDTDTPEETDGSAAEGPKETDEPVATIPEETETPKESAAKAPKNGKDELPEITNIKISGGTMTWDRVSGAEGYDIYVNSKGHTYEFDDYFSGCAINNEIDNMIWRRAIAKSNQYTIEIYAVDEDDIKLAYGKYEGYEYDSKAKPMDELSKIKVSSDDVITWDSLSNAKYYYLEIRESIDGTNYSVDDCSFNLNKQIDSLIKRKSLIKLDKYTIVISALDEHFDLIAESTYIHEYKSEAEPVEPEKFTATISDDGILSWKAYPNVGRYYVSINNCDFDTKENTFDVKRMINKMIKDRNMLKSGPYTIKIRVYDTDWVLIAEGTADRVFEYESTAVYISEKGTVKNLKITNGILKWDAYKDAVEYLVLIEDSNYDNQSLTVKATSVELDKTIDQFIKAGKIAKGKNKYGVSVTALDSDGAHIANVGTSYEYDIDNPMTVTGRTVKVKKKKVKKKTQYVSRAAAINIKNAKGTLTYKKLSGNKKIRINAKTGKVTVKKKLKKGKYKVKVQVQATVKADECIITSVKTTTFTIKVK